MSRNKTLAAMVELCCAEKDVERARDQMDTRAYNKAVARLTAARNAILAMGVQV